MERRSHTHTCVFSICGAHTHTHTSGLSTAHVYTPPPLPARPLCLLFPWQPADSIRRILMKVSEEQRGEQGELFLLLRCSSPPGWGPHTTRKSLRYPSQQSVAPLQTDRPLGGVGGGSISSGVMEKRRLLRPADNWSLTGLNWLLLKTPIDWEPSGTADSGAADATSVAGDAQGDHAWKEKHLFLSFLQRKQAESIHYLCASVSGSDARTLTRSLN